MLTPRHLIGVGVAGGGSVTQLVVIGVGVVVVGLMVVLELGKIVVVLQLDVK